MEYKIKIEYSTLIKLTCATLIVLHHFLQHTFQANDVMSNCLPLFIINQQLGYTGVAIFFFLSGYGLMESEKKKHLSFFDYSKRRVYKIYLPFLLITALWLPVFYYVSGEQTQANTLIYQLLWGGADNALWFIKVIIALYVVFYIYSCIYKNKILSSIYLLLMTALVSILAYYTFGSYSYVSIPIFSLGVLYSTYDYREICLKDKFTITLICYAITTAITGYFTQNIIFSFQISINYLAVIILLLLIQKDFNINIEQKKIKLLSDTSFNIYLVHNKVLFVLIATGILDIGLYIVTIIFALIIFTLVRRICRI